MRHIAILALRTGLDIREISVFQSKSHSHIFCITGVFTLQVVLLAQVRLMLEALLSTSATVSIIRVAFCRIPVFLP